MTFAGVQRLAPFAILGLASLSNAVRGDEQLSKPQIIEPRFVHLREGIREWSSFPEAPATARLEVRFAAAKNDREYALRLRQQDVKQAWRMLLNDKPLGELT